jgi:ribosomal protein S18 acetylase RimI-like enzyme
MSPDTTDAAAGRLALARDLDRVAETVTLAFATDPVWGVALARPDGRTDHLLPYWRLFVDEAFEQGGVRVLLDGAAVSVWVPPGGAEISADGLAVLERLVRVHLGADGANELYELFDRFESNHPRAEPHAYLSLLATHPDHRGRGIGQALLADDLAGWDAAGVPSYLESTNPANDHRYERAGFRRVGGFRAVRDDAPISTMWRAVGGAGA